MVAAGLIAVTTTFSAEPPVANSYHQQVPQLSPLKILFTDDQDVSEVWGSLKFGASPLRPLSECDDPGFEVKCCIPRADGSWDVYGYTGGHDIYGERGDPTKKLSVWKIHRAVTRNGASKVKLRSRQTTSSKRVSSK